MPMHGSGRMLCEVEVHSNCEDEIIPVEMHQPIVGRHHSPRPFIPVQRTSSCPRLSDDSRIVVPGSSFRCERRQFCEDGNSNPHSRSKSMYCRRSPSKRESRRKSVQVQPSNRRRIKVPIRRAATVKPSSQSRGSSHYTFEGRTLFHNFAPYEKGPVHSSGGRQVKGQGPAESMKNCEDGKTRRIVVCAIVATFSFILLCCILAVIVTLTHQSELVAANKTVRYYTFSPDEKVIQIRKENEELMNSLHREPSSQHNFYNFSVPRPPT